MLKICSVCSVQFEKAAHGRICRTCSNARQRAFRARTGNKITRTYEKTPKGFLMRTYRNMVSRVTGIQRLKAHLYEGKEILSREEFHAWAERTADVFAPMFKAWMLAGYPTKLAPSVDRKDSALGYVAENMRWLTHAENSRGGAIAKSQQRLAPIDRSLRSRGAKSATSARDT